MKQARDLGLIGAALCRSITPEQINNNREAGPLRRTAQVRNVNKDERTVEVAFSSETPVARWFGDEILDHSSGAMVMDRLDNGAAVLWNHDPDKQIGVVESARIDKDRRGRAVLRFGSGPKADEKWQDVVSGIIRHISVGYFVRDIVIEQREGEPDEVTVTRWEPYEISLVSIPADPSVGVGRAHGNPPEEAPAEPDNTSNQPETNRQEGSDNMKTIITRNSDGALVRAEVDEDGNIVKELEVLQTAKQMRALGGEGATAEQTRAARILELGEQYDAQAEAIKAVRDGTTPEAFSRSLLDVVAARVAQTPAGQSTRDPLTDNAGQIGMSDSEIRRFSFLRAARALLNPSDRTAQRDAEFEFEASAEAQRSMGRNSEGITVPVDVLTRTFNTDTSGTNPGDTGGYLIDTTLATQSFIEMLRNRAVLLSLGTPMAGLIGNVDIPGQTGSGNVFIVGEDEDVGEGSMDVGNVSLTPTTIGVFGRVTRRMLQQSSLDVEMQFRSSLATDLALGIDHYGFYGDGVGNNPLGILNTTGINAVTFGAVQPTYAELIQMETEVDVDNALTDGMRYIGNSKFRGHCKSTQKFSGTNGQPIWEQGNTVNGSDVEITNQFADGDVLFGNMRDVMIGLWGGLDILVDPYTQSLSGTRRIILHQDFDIALRRKESFCLGRDGV
ncbi:hypothetical protein GCM10016455_05580 [Aliiroseovarius zhejiangensis]|uniref:Phage major capsid protein n=1 Tax=Aliiroseovarius zhejiangensis TaxID=1632025 RepID=A0ABQ3IQ53_9RHOB|nr:phage major capsid protein [Aliiroseovarius zhejiangensis]GHE88331.1 hypothetical protein GCM10016455_05580 [Aliiroseovarius zhejiangensis]